MNPISSKKKLRAFLNQVHSNAQKGKVSAELAYQLSTFLLKHLSRSVKPSKTSKILDSTTKFISFYPLRFAISLIPYLSSGHIQDITKLIQVFKRFYFSDELLLNLCISSLILSTFRAVSSLSDISSAVVSILDAVSTRNRVYECIWKSILKSPKARMPALNYLHYRLLVDNKTRALHALIVCLEDQSIQVKRCALDLCRRVFNFSNMSIEKKYKLSILVHALKLFENIEKSLLSRIFEWINPEQEELLNENVLEIVSEALLAVLMTVEIEKSIVIISNFICSLQSGEQVLNRIIIPMAIYNHTADIALVSDSITSLIASNIGLFWVQFQIAFLDSFKDKSTQKILFKVLQNSLIQLPFEYKTIDAIILALFENFDLQPKRNLKNINHLVHSIEKTSINPRQLKGFYEKAYSFRKPLSVILLRFYKLEVDCDELIEKLCSEKCQNDESRIEVINIRLEYKEKTIKKESIEFVVRNSLLCNDLTTLNKLVKLVPKRINSLLESILDFDEALAISSLVQIQKCNLKLSTPVLIQAIELLKDCDPKIIYQTVKWLNTAIQNDCNFYLALIDSLEDKKKSPPTYIAESVKILCALKDLIRLGGSPLVELLLANSQTRLFAILENFVTSPPHYSNILRVLACELISEIVKYSSSETSPSLIDITVSFLLQCIKIEDNKMLLLMLQILENHLLVLTIEAKNNSSTKGLINILAPLVLIIEIPEVTVRNSWLNFISQLIPFMIEFLDSNISIKYTNALLKRYFEVFSNNGDSKILNGLAIITKQTLFHPVMLNRNNINKVVFFSLQKYLDLYISCQNTEFADIVKEIILLLCKCSMYKLLKSFVLIWMEHSPYDTKSWPVLHDYINVLVDVQLEAEDVILHVKEFLTRHYEALEPNQEKLLSFASLVCVLQEKLLVSQTSQIWSHSIDIFKLLQKVTLAEVTIFVMESIHILKKRVGIEGLDLSQQEELRKLLKDCANSSIFYLHSQTKASTVPYRFLTYYEKISISEVYIGTIQEVMHNIICIGVEKSGRNSVCGELLADFTKIVFDSFKTPEQVIQKGGKIILKYLEYESPAVSRALQRRINDLIKNPDFFKFFHCDDDLCVWIQIIRIFSLSFYWEKHALLEKIIEYVEPGIVSRLFGKYQFREDSLNLLAFIIFLGNPIDDGSILIDISEILFNTIGEQKLFNSCCLILKSLYLKVSPINFSEVVFHVLPPLFPIFTQIMENFPSDRSLNSCLKLLEFFFITENEVFFIFQSLLLKNLDHIEEHAFLKTPSELRQSSATKTDIEGEIDLVSVYEPIDYMNTNIDMAIQHACSYLHNGKPLSNKEKIRTYIEKSIIIELIN